MDVKRDRPGEEEPEEGHGRSPEMQSLALAAGLVVLILSLLVFLYLRQGSSMEFFYSLF